MAGHHTTPLPGIMASTSSPVVTLALWIGSVQASFVLGSLVEVAVVGSRSTYGPSP